MTRGDFCVTMVKFTCRARNVWQMVRLQLNTRYLAFSVLLTVAILTLEISLQGPFIRGRYLRHRQNAYLLHRIKNEHDVRQPNADRVVPKIVHFTWGRKPFVRFHHMMCILSAYHLIRPEYVYIWYDKVKPSGKWWNYLRNNITDFNSVFQYKQRDDPTEIFGHKIQISEHKSDVIRLDVMKNYGGIYMDTDVLTLKNFDPLLYYDVTMGLETPDGLCNGVIIAKPNATFLNVWWEEYRTFNDGQWGQHSVKLPALLAVIHPHLVNVLESTLHRPNWFELEYIYGNKKYNWRQNYAMHLWYRMYDKDHDLESIKKLDSTLGEMFRYIIYGNPKLIL